jgi:hypothetical protein
MLDIEADLFFFVYRLVLRTGRGGLMHTGGKLLSVADQATLADDHSLRNHRSRLEIFYHHPLNVSVRLSTQTYPERACCPWCW